MPNIRFANLGREGLIVDPAPSLTSPEAISDGRDFLTDGVSCYRAPGTVKLFDLDIQPLERTVWRDENQELRIIVTNFTYIYIYKEDGTYIDVTPVGGSLTTGAKITWTILNGVLVMNSSIDGLYYCDPSDDYEFKILQTGLSFKADAVVAFRYNLVALGITQSGNYYPHKIMWSISAEDGSLPSEWTPSLTNDAGDDLVGETPGALVGAVPIRDTLFVIKEDGIYSMRWVGLPYVFQIQRMKGQIGVLTPHLAAEARGRLMLAPLSDILAFDGVQTVSLADKKVRQFLDTWTKDINPENCQLIYELARQHLVLGVPDPIESADSRMQSGWIYSTLHHTWSHKGLNYVYGMSIERIGNDSSASLIVFESNEDDDEWWVAELSSLHWDEEQPSFVTTHGIPIFTDGSRVRVTRVFPEIRGSAETVQLSIGVQETENSEIIWSPVFDISSISTKSFGINLSGRFLAYRLDYTGTESWHLDALTLEVETDGER